LIKNDISVFVLAGIDVRSINRELPNVAGGGAFERDLYVVGSRGGDGCSAFRRDRYRRIAMPHEIRF
jgi:hypothetical protein